MQHEWYASPRERAGSSARVGASARPPIHDNSIVPQSIRDTCVGPLGILSLVLQGCFVVGLLLGILGLVRSRVGFRDLASHHILDRAGVFAQGGQNLQHHRHRARCGVSHLWLVWVMLCPRRPSRSGLDQPIVLNGAGMARGSDSSSRRSGFSMQSLTCEEPDGFMAVNDPMVVGGGQIHHEPQHDGARDCPGPRAARFWIRCRPRMPDCGGLRWASAS